MKFQLTITCNNAAFKDDNEPADDINAMRDEVARLLREAAMNVSNGSMTRALFDSNGNACGRFEFLES